jgi:hypothetical protein
MTIKNTFLGTLVATFLLSCTNDSTSDLLNIEPIGVKSIIDNNCAVCHGTTPIPGTNLSLTNYEEVRNAVLNRGLINRILLEEGNSSLMPQGGPKLPQPIINIIIKWQEDGLQL